MAYDHDKWFNLALARGAIVIAPPAPEPVIESKPAPDPPRPTWLEEIVAKNRALYAEREKRRELAAVPARKRALDYARKLLLKGNDDIVQDEGIICRELYEQVDDPLEWEYSALAVAGGDYNVYLTYSEIEALFNRPKYKKKRWWKYNY